MCLVNFGHTYVHMYICTYCAHCTYYTYCTYRTYRTICTYRRDITYCANCAYCTLHTVHTVHTVDAVHTVRSGRTIPYPTVLYHTVSYRTAHPSGITTSPLPPPPPRAHLRWPRHEVRRAGVNPLWVYWITVYVEQMKQIAPP